MDEKDDCALIWIFLPTPQLGHNLQTSVANSQKPFSKGFLRYCCQIRAAFEEIWLVSDGEAILHEGWVANIDGTGTTT